eukprot:4477098-Pleurochrysis_carterae.AAC.1
MCSRTQTLEAAPTTRRCPQTPPKLYWTHPQGARQSNTVHEIFGKTWQHGVHASALKSIACTAGRKRAKGTSKQVRHKQKAFEKDGPNAGARRTFPPPPSPPMRRPPSQLHAHAASRPA